MTAVRLSQTHSLGSILEVGTPTMIALNDKHASWRSFVTASIAVVAFAGGLIWLAKHFTIRVAAERVANVRILHSLLPGVMKHVW